jgi:hypothetical protein
MIEMSQEIKNISKALVGAQADVGVALKNQANAHFKSQYADLPAVLEVATPALARHGLALVQCPVEGDGTAMTLTTLLIHESGEWMLFPSASMPLQAQTAHGYGSALSYLRRYTTQACLKISVGLGEYSEDDDANEATAQAPKAKPKQKKSKAAFEAKHITLAKAVAKKDPAKVEAELVFAIKELEFMISSSEEVGTIEAKHIALAKTVVGKRGGGAKNKTPIERVQAASLYLGNLLKAATP